MNFSRKASLCGAPLAPTFVFHAFNKPKLRPLSLDSMQLHELADYKWANALVPPTPILRAMVIRCYPMLSYMFPYLPFVPKLFSSAFS